MRTYYMLMWVLGILSFLLCITQIIWPVLTQRPMFPLLRNKRRAAEAAVTQHNEEQDVDDILKQIPASRTTPRRRATA